MDEVETTGQERVMQEPAISLLNKLVQAKARHQKEIAKLDEVIGLVQANPDLNELYDKLSNL